MAKQTKVTGPSPEMVEELTFALHALTDQVRMLRQAVDEIEEELGWAIRCRIISPLPRTQITSLPLDPLADDFVQRVNEVQTLSPETTPRRQVSLW